MNYYNTFAPINGLSKIGFSSGGLCWINFAKWEDVLLWPSIDPLTGICKTPIVLKAGAVWYELSPPEIERIFTESQESENAGDFYKMQVNGTLAGNDASRVLSIGTMAYHQYVILVNDRDGLTRMIGNEDAGADFKNQYNSGDKSNSKKRVITFNFESKNPAPIYSAIKIDSPSIKTFHMINFDFTNTIVTADNVDTIPLSNSASVGNNANSFELYLNISSKYFIISEDASEPVKTRFINGFNSEPIPNFTFDTPIVKGLKRYYFTRGLRSFDSAYSSIFNV